MSVLSPGSGEAFVIRTWKTLSTNPSVRWANSYECRFFALGGLTDLQSLGAALIGFEAALALNTTRFLYFTVSTWAPDSHPYNPDAFLTESSTVSGAIAFSSGFDLDLRVCLRLNRVTPTGRQGKLFLRNSLTTTQVNNHAGTYSLVDPSAMETVVSGALVATALNGNLEDGGLEPTLCLIGASEVTRKLTSITAGGVSMVKLNHKYFDRA